ncbi:Eukaryotic translation initiation factor 5A, partial [Rhodotorula mucilaginosa]
MTTEERAPLCCPSLPRSLLHPAHGGRPGSSGHARRPSTLQAKKARDGRIVDDGFLNLLTADGGEKNDVKVPDNEIGQEIQKAFDDGVDIAVTVTSAMGEEHCLAWKPAP